MEQKIIYYITGNKSKFKEAAAILRVLNIKLIKKDLKLKETRTLNQEEVAIEKARQAFKKLRKPVLTDDAAIYFQEYKNFPGTYTKSVFESIGFRGIKRLLDTKNRKAYFKVLICYKDSKSEKIFSGIWKGRIINNVSKKFNPDWQYNSIFIPLGCKKVLSEMSLEERAKKSHRRKALNKLIKYFKKNERN